MDYKIQATFKTDRRLCPFDCSGHGVCVASDGSSDDAAGVCMCAVPQYVGKYCQDTTTQLNASGDTYEPGIYPRYGCSDEGQGNDSRWGLGSVPGGLL